MYRIFPSKDYIKSYKKLERSGHFSPKAKRDLEFAIDTLAAGEKLPPEYKDHQLSGELKEYRDCHIKGDLILIYQIRGEEFILALADLGSHSELFG
jgi:mRNA interferase YafQ